MRCPWPQCTKEGTGLRGRDNHTWWMCPGHVMSLDPIPQELLDEDPTKRFRRTATLEERLAALKRV